MFYLGFSTYMLLKRFVKFNIKNFNFPIKTKAERFFFFINLLLPHSHARSFVPCILVNINLLGLYNHSMDDYETVLSVGN